MRIPIEMPKIRPAGLALAALALALFWLVLLAGLPSSLTGFFHAYSLAAFVIVAAAYYLVFRFLRKHAIWAGLGLIMLLFGLTLSYQWTSGFTDNFIIGGLLPYKDAKNYYYAANLVLNGLPVVNAEQGSGRPLFPGLLSSLLLLTGQNLKITLGLLVQLTGVALYLSARSVHRSMGSLAAALYSALMYFYIQPFLGYALSEVPGFLLGCLAFVITWKAAASLDWKSLLLGLATLMVAVSTRAGAFFLFPVMILWAGWAWRKPGGYSWKAAALVGTGLCCVYLIANTLFPRLLGVPPGATFGNLAYAIYGQVNGGTGWHSAIADLNTRDPSRVYRAALDIFVRHPAGFFVGSFKAYRDFFLPVGTGIFPFGQTAHPNWADLLLWAAAVILLGWAIVRLTRRFRSNTASLLVAAFLGLLFSIPFLPPIDGGSRFYAASMPFFLALPAVAAGQFATEAQSASSIEAADEDVPLASLIAAVLLGMTLLVPLVTMHVSSRPAIVTPACPAGEEAFAIRTPPGSYIDLLPAGTATCGTVPAVCLADFEQNATEKTTDDFYQALSSMAQSSAAGIRIMPSFNLPDARFSYFVALSPLSLEQPADQVISGCGSTIETKNQSIFRIDSLVSSVK